MPKKTHGLARGLDSLLPEVDMMTSGGGQEIAIGDIDPNPDQPRRAFSEESIAQLAQSIREQGLLQPILVVPMNGGRYRIVAGERRWRAARMAGLDRVPCIIREMDVPTQMEIALVENLQREDLNPIEAAQGIQTLMRQCGYTQEAVAARLCKSRPAVANLLRLLTLPEDIITMVRQGTLSAGHARVLAGLESDEMKMTLARQTITNEWSVRQLENAVALMRKSTPTLPKTPQKVHSLPAELTELETFCRETFGVRATITGNQKKGKITLQYYSAEELEQVLFRDVLGEAKTHVSGSAGRIGNVKLSAQIINGLVLNSGETFSYNESVGKRTADRGFKPAPAYVKGETVDEIGGGICQTSTTLYGAVLRSGLEIVERSNHSIPSTYCPIGQDAAVSWPNMDFKFRNNTEYPLSLIHI